MKLNQFAFLRAFGRRFSSQIEPPTKCFFNSMEKEVWKSLSGLYSSYKVSNFGKVIGPKGKVLKYCKHRGGYLMVSLTNMKVRKMCTVHRLVALNFIDNPNNLPIVNHIDGNKKNNSVTNLEWCTLQENSIHAYKNKLADNDYIGKPFLKGITGFLHPMSKSIAQMDLEGNIIKIFGSGCDMENTSSYKRNLVGQVCRGKRKMYKGFLWKFV